MRKTVLSIFVSLSGVLLLSLNFFVLAGIRSTNADRRNRLLAMQELTVYADRLQNHVNMNLQYADFLEILLLKDPSASDESLKPYFDLILSHCGVIKNIALAPGGVVRAVYPLEGNEAAVGHDLLADSARNSFVRTAMETRESVTQGPVLARQGGYLIFNRKAIYLPDGTPGATGSVGERFWGLAVITLDFNEVVAETGLLAERDGYFFALRAEKTDGANDFTWGHVDIFEQDSLARAVHFPNQAWALHIYPEDGWRGKPDLSDLFALASYFVIIAAGAVLLFFHAQQYQERLEQALCDPLTGTLNKRAFRSYVQKRLRQSLGPHALCIMDLNGFKEINDEYGHPVGDLVLIELSRRIGMCLRTTDRVSRFGGDEFILFIDSLDYGETVPAILERIEKSTSRPIQLRCETNSGESCPPISLYLAKGYAVFPDDGRTFDELYSAADARMYCDKEASKSGKNGKNSS
ncbi:MAG: sensor domain-containing diguanylate cyclase [Spirochaetales bacterium]|nr:sensor domain-containing diguanylate cyclase [Spirochaetales bacterium]